MSRFFATYWISVSRSVGALADVCAGGCTFRGFAVTHCLTGRSLATSAAAADLAPVRYGPVHHHALPSFLAILPVNTVNCLISCRRTVK